MFRNIVQKGCESLRNVIQICLEFIVCVHGVFQKIVRKKKSNSSWIHSPLGEVLLGISTLTLSLCFCLALGTILLVMMFYRYLVDKYLQWIHGSDYVGLLGGADTVWSIEDESRGIVNGLMIIESNLEPEIFYEQMNNRICNTLLKYDKFTYIRGRCGGFLYYLRNKTTNEGIVKKLEIMENHKELSKDQLLILLSNYCNAPLPYNDTGTNEILIGLQSVKWRDSAENSFQYPVLYRLHHCIGDGISVQQLITQKLADKSVSTVISQIFKNSRKKNVVTKTNTLIKRINNIHYDIKNVFKILGKILRLSAHRLSYLEDKESNVLHGKKLSGQKHFVCCVEDSPTYLKLVKEAKKNIDGAGFSHIVVAAVAQSFSEYFHEVCSPTEIPEKIHAAITVLPPNEKIDANMTNILLHNRFSLALTALPLKNKEDVLKTVEFLKNDFNSIRHSIDVVWNYWQMKYAFGLLPVNIVKILMTKADSTLGLSNLPGTDVLTVLNGCKVLDFIFWIPNKAIVGAGLSVYTYDNRFQLGLLADKTVIPTYEDAKNILENVFKNIRKICIASKSYDVR